MNSAANTDLLLNNIVATDVAVTANVNSYDFGLWISLGPEAECYWTIDGEIQGLERRPELVKAMRMARLRARMEANLAARAAR